MKVRRSFVSNSSSASFIIKVLMSEEKLAEVLYQNTTSFDAVSMYYKLKETGESLLGSEFMSGDEFLNALDLFVIKEQKLVNSQEVRIFEIPKENLVKIVRLFLKAYYMSFDKIEDSVEIIKDTIMYNDFESFGLFIQKLVYLFTVTNTPFTWKIVEETCVVD